MPNLPPGIVYLANHLPAFSSPLILLYFIIRALDAFGVVRLPLWLLVLSNVLAIPIALFLKASYNNLINRRNAAALGAVLPPRVHDRWPAGIGILIRSINNLKSGFPGEAFYDLAKKYGYTFHLRILFEDRVFTAEPNYIKAILATQFDHFAKGPVFDIQMRSFLGTGVFNSDGDMWKFHRAMTRPFFSKERITHFDIFERHAQDAIRQLKARLSEGFPVDIQDLASRFTMDSATEFLFAKDVQSLAAGLPYPHYSPLSKSETAAKHPANIFSKAFDEAQRRIAIRSRIGASWPLTEFWKDKVQEKMGPIYDFINPILADAVSRKTEAQEGEKVDGANVDREVQDGECLIDHLVNLTHDQMVIRDETLNILLAGRDTTTNTISYSIYMLAKHPHVLSRLRDEILTKIGSSMRPNYDDMKEMKYLRAVINETLRLYPAVPFNIRTTTKATLWSPKEGGKPFYIPPNTKTPYSVFFMHRRTDLWGPDANEFDPDRFLDDRLGKYLTSNPFIFLPFNAGPRICLGQQFAYHETSFFLIRLLQQFSKITMAPEAQPPESRPPLEWAKEPSPKGDSLKMKNYLTMSIMGGCWVTMEEDTNFVDTV